MIYVPIVETNVIWLLIKLHQIQSATNCEKKNIIISQISSSSSSSSSSQNVIIIIIINHHHHHKISYHVNIIIYHFDLFQDLPSWCPLSPCKRLGGHQTVPCPDGVVAARAADFTVDKGGGNVPIFSCSLKAHLSISWNSQNQHELANSVN